MRIIKKEALEFSERETDAIRLVAEICTGLMREATDPNLKKLAAETYDCIATLWGEKRMKCKNCGYYWQEAGEDYPCCHYSANDPWLAPCEYEEEENDE